MRHLVRFIASTFVLLLVGCVVREPLPMPRTPWSMTPAESFREQPPIAEAPERLDLPTVERWRLDNGLRVVFLRVRGARTGAVALASATAGEDGLSERAGWSTLVGRLLPWTEVGRDRGQMSRRVITHDIPQAIESFAEAVRGFAPTTPELERARAELEGDASAQWRLRWLGSLIRGRQLLWGEQQRVAVPLLGTERTLEGVTAGQLQIHFQETWHPERSVLTVVGDIEPDRLRLLVDEHFGDWSSAGRFAAELAEPVTPSEPNDARVLGVRGATELASVMLLESAPPCGHRDWPLFLVVHQLLGGMYTSRANETLRDAEGLTYGVHSQYTAFRTHGELVMTTNVSIWQAEEALRLFQGELRRLTVEGPESEELDRARALARERLMPRLDSSQNTAESLAGFALCGRDYDALDVILAEVEQATAAELRQVARRWLRPEQAPIVVVGEMGALSTQINRADVGRARYTQ